MARIECSLKNLDLFEVFYGTQDLPSQNFPANRDSIFVTFSEPGQVPGFLLIGLGWLLVVIG